MLDKIRFKIAFVDTRSGSILFEQSTKGMLLNSSLTSMDAFLSKYKSYLFDHPYTRFIITPLVSEDTGELFNLKNF